MPQTKEQKRISYYKHRDKMLQKQKEYNQRNREVILTKHKEYYQKTKAERLSKFKLYAAEHKEEIAAYQKEYREINSEKLKVYSKTRYHETKVLKGRYRSLDEHTFDVIDTTEKAYWLGLLYTDGSIDKNRKYIRLESKDLDLVKNFQSFLSAKHNIYTRNYENKRNPTYLLSIGCMYLCNKLGEYGIIPNKTYEHSTPVYIPEGNLTSHFWRGCIDGDGCIGHYSKQDRTYLVLSNNNQELLYKCKAFFDNLGGIFLQKTKSNAHYQWSYSPRGNRILKYLDKLYCNSTVACRLERKYNIFQTVKEIYSL